MSDKSSSASIKGIFQRDPQVKKMLVRFLLILLLPYVTLFVCAGTLNWLMGWLYTIFTLVVVILSRVIIARRYPDLLSERGRYMENVDAKRWDKILVTLVALIGPLVALVVVGLDRRFGWSPPIVLWLQLLFLALTALGALLSMWAMIVNRFFSATVRIQSDRGHYVVDAGPYRIVRHPAYASGFIYNLATAPALGSLWGLIPAVLLVGLLVLRTALEDKTLQEELPGYREYANRVRYRLLPGIW